MFNFRIATTLFFVVLLALNILAILGYSISWIAYLVLFALYFGISVTASFFMSTNFHMKSYSKGETSRKVLALTFDDGPDPEVTPLVLDMLKKNEIKATFFLIGRKIKGNETIIRRIMEEGHFIGAHSFSHGNFFSFYPPEKMKKEFRETSELLFQATGKKIRLFRPPYGVINPFVRKALKNLNYHVIGFSNRLYDTVNKDPEAVTERFRQQLSEGDIVVLHDTYPGVVHILEKILDEALKKGYRVVPLDELLNIEPYEK
jgi:peptidoglycan/xylan/chitin deacetylase (PgdA/CDA1 family)